MKPVVILDPHWRTVNELFSDVALAELRQQYDNHTTIRRLHTSVMTTVITLSEVRATFILFRIYNICSKVRIRDFPKLCRRIAVSGILEFFSSLTLFGWFLFVLLVLILLNIRKLIRLRSPLDSQDQKLWRETSGKIGGPTKPQYLECKDEHR